MNWKGDSIKTMSTNVTQAQTFVQFLDALNVRGSVRHKLDPTTGIEYNHVFEMAQCLGMTYAAATDARAAFIQRNPQLSEKFRKLVFDPLPGQKQNHPTWGADAEGMYHFILSLKDTHSRAFREFAVKAGVLTLGGSRAL